MPPTVLASPLLAAGVGAVGSIAGGVIGSRGQNKATEASARANDAALQFEREKEATRRADYEKAMGEYQKAFGAYQTRKDALLKRYGFSIPDSEFAPPAGGMPPGGAPAGLPSAPAAALPGPPVGPPGQQGLTLGEMAARKGLGSWDWNARLGGG